MGEHHGAYEIRMGTGGPHRHPADAGSMIGNEFLDDPEQENEGEQGRIALTADSSRDKKVRYLCPPA